MSDRVEDLGSRAGRIKAEHERAGRPHVPAAASLLREAPRGVAP